MANGRDKKHRSVDERRANLKKCEIKQLPNCWPENLSRYPVSLFHRLSCSLIPRLHPICLPARFPFRFSRRKSPPPSARRDHLSRERFPRPPLFSSPSILSCRSRHDLLIRSRAFTRAIQPPRPLPLTFPLFLTSLVLPAIFILERISDPIRRRRLPEANCGIIRRISFA